LTVIVVDSDYFNYRLLDIQYSNDKPNSNGSLGKVALSRKHKTAAGLKTRLL